MIVLDPEPLNGHSFFESEPALIQTLELPEPSDNPLKFLGYLHSSPRSVIEIRALECPENRGRSYRTIASGYFSDFNEAAMAALIYDNKEPAGVYVTINRCKPELLARSTNVIQWKAKVTTADEAILHLDNLFLDIDASRLSGISATESEKDAAVALMHHIADTLVSEGWPQPLRCMSGNGGSALFRIDLPNNEESTELIHGVLRGLAERFDTPNSTVDQTTHNAARIMKIAGTTARKGCDFVGEPGNEARRHRKSFFWPPAGELQVTSKALLQQVYKPDPKQQQASSPTNTPAHAYTDSQSRILVEHYLADRGVVVTKIKPHGDGTIYILDRCPFHEEHGGNGEVSVTQGGRGGLKFECKHNSCSNFGWTEFRDKIGPLKPEHYDPPLRAKTAKSRQEFAPGTIVMAGDRGNYGEIVEDCGATCSVRFVSPEGVEVTKSLPKGMLTSVSGDGASEALALDSVPISDWVKTYTKLRDERIHGLLRQGEVGSIIAAPKVGKSWLSLGLALSAGFGLPWIGFNVERGRVLLIDNELHRETISSRLQWMAEKRELDVSRSNIEAVSLRGLNLNLQTLGPTIAKAVEKKFSYIILDAWYRLIPPGMDENSNSDMTTLFNLLDKYAHDTGATILAVHHTSKGNQGNKSVTDVGSGAGAQSRAVDAHLVIREHEQPDAFVVDAACRSFAPLKPFCMRRNFPLWERAEDLDPTQIKQERRGQKNQANSSGKPIVQWTAKMFAEAFITSSPRDTATVKAFAREAGLSTRQVSMFLDLVKSEGHAHFREKQGRRPAMYCSAPFDGQESFA